MISILVPVKGNKDLNHLLVSIEKQSVKNCEIIIIRNGIEHVYRPYICMKGHPRKDMLLCELFLQQSGKGNALNAGIKIASHDLICVVDADCVLEEHALEYAIKHFEDNEVAAVGGKLLVMNKKCSPIVQAQKNEYLITFLITRSLFAKYNAQCLISGAFGLFRRNDLMEIGGYDTNTIGEDMEIVLRLQNGGIERSSRKIIYEKTAVCSTVVPHSMKKLLHQRERWQRGLMDCLIKHRNMIANRAYDFLGIAMIYQLVVCLIGPITSPAIYILICVFLKSVGVRVSPLLLMIPYFSFKIFETFIAAYLEADKHIRPVANQAFRLAFATIVLIVLQLPLSIVRIYGMICFKKRRMIW